MEKNLEKVTKELCESKKLIFAPTNAGEAKEIEQALFKMGYKWPDGANLPTPQMCVTGKMVLHKGKIYCGPRIEDFMDASYCTAEQFRPGYVGEVPAAAVEKKDLETAQQGLDDMIGLDQIKEDVEDDVSFTILNERKKARGLPCKSIGHHMILTGPTGTGKTTVVEKIGDIYCALGITKSPKVIKATRADLVGQHIGDTEKKTKDLLKKAMDEGCILFLEEAYTLASDGYAGDFGYKALETILEAMEVKENRDKFIVIAAGYPGLMDRFINFNPGFKSRFPIYLSCEALSMDQLGLIMDQMLAEHGSTMEPKARELALQLLQQDKDRSDEKDRKMNSLDSSFGNGRVARNLVEKVVKITGRRLRKAGALDTAYDGPDGPESKAYDKKLTTITLEDMKKVSLKDITVPRRESTLGFHAKPGTEQPAQEKQPALAATAQATRPAAKAFAAAGS